MSHHCSPQRLRLLRFFFFAFTSTFSKLQVGVCVLNRDLQDYADGPRPGFEPHWHVCWAAYAQQKPERPLAWRLPANCPLRARAPGLWS